MDIFYIGSGFGIYNYTLFCKEIPTKVNVLHHSDFSWSPSSGLSFYIELDTPINDIVVNCEPYICNSITIYPGHYYVTIIEPFDTISSYPTSFNVIIQYWTWSFLISSRNIEFQDEFTILYALYPLTNEIGSVRFGLNEFPIISITTNSSNYHSPIIRKSNNSFIPITFSNKLISYKPMYGSGSKYGGTGTTIFMSIQLTSTPLNVYIAHNPSFTLTYTGNLLVLPPPSEFIFYPINLTPSTSSIYPIITKITFSHFSIPFYFFSYDLTMKYVNGYGSSFDYTFNWPYGFSKGNNTGYFYDASYLNSGAPSNISRTLYTPFQGLAAQQPFNNVAVNSEIIIILDYSFKRISFEYYTFSITFKQNLPSNIKYIELVDSDLKFKRFGIESLTLSLVSGTERYEMFVDSFFTISSISIITTSYLIFEYKDFLSYNPLIRLVQPSFLNIDFNIYKIQNTTNMLKPEINPTDQDVFNVFTFNFTDIISNQKDYIFALEFETFDSIEFDNVHKYWYSNWNDETRLYEIKFEISKNSQPGYVPFKLLLNSKIYIKSYQFPITSQLFINCSKYDGYGPVITKLDKFPNVNGIVNCNGFGLEFGWNLRVTDLINGFKSGHIIVRGVMDGSIFKFQLNPKVNLQSGDGIYNSDFKITIVITSNVMATQKYVISEIELFDTGGNRNYFSIYSKDSIGIAPYNNPLIQFMGKLNPTTISINCITETPDKTSPIIKSLKIVNPGQIIDVGKIDRSIQFELNVIDLESGIRIDQLPIVYLIGVDLQISEIPCFIQNLNIDNPILNVSTNVYYTCNGGFPFGFGYPDGFIYSVYGVLNNAGYYSGASFSQLFENGLIGSMDSIPVEFKNLISQITDYSFNELGDGSINLYGYGLTNASKVYLYLTPAISGNFTILSDRVVKIENIYQYPSFINQIFQINVLVNSGGSYFTNSIYITPKYSKYINRTTSPVITPTTTPTIPTTNAPQICKNQCYNNLKHGYCEVTTGCICYSPWIGLDCSSQIIVIPQPTVNISNPTTVIPIGDEENQEIFFKSLISIVSLIEFDFQSNPIKIFKFDKWIYTKINSTINQYTTDIISPYDKSLTNITVLLQWYENETNINFANQQIKMSPSSIKYTISIGPYSFSSSLNKLQLIMSASFESSDNQNTDSCSSKEFGETSSGDNSNYLKLQVNDHSIYGRFIKRGIVDDRIITISNELLNIGSSSSVDIGVGYTDNGHSSNSLIAINIPWYEKSVVIDPDFSVLVDSDRVSNNDPNSVCLRNTGNENKLSTSQLAGIIVGSVVVSTAIVISIIYVIIKKKRQVNFFKNVSQKLKRYPNGNTSFATTIKN